MPPRPLLTAAALLCPGAAAAAPAAYWLMPAGRCNASFAASPVASAAECGAAAAAVGEADTTPSNCSDHTHPQGCYLHPSSKTQRLWWCPGGDPSYAKSDRRSLCRVPPTYTVMPTGECAEGTAPVASADECGAAAAAAGEADTAASACSDAAHPRGCYIHPTATPQKRLWWCPGGDPHYAQADRRVICRTQRPRTGCRGGDACTCMPRGELLARAATWVGRVPYSHSTSADWGYPTDCSGLVSWAANITTMPSGAPHTDKAAWLGSGTYSTRLGTDPEVMRPGDIITHVSCKGKKPPIHGLFTGHVFIFDRWEDPSNKTRFWAYESTETFDQPECCLKRTCPCLNHHVLKDWARWGVRGAEELCVSDTYGNCTGGAHRLHPDLLCPPAG